MKFLKGMFVKAPREKAPDFVLAEVSIKREELIKTLQELDQEWINAQIKRWEDKVYMSIDTWTPDKKKQESNEEAPW